MRYGRAETTNGAVVSVALIDDEIVRVEGDIFGRFDVTDEPVEVARWLAPVRPAAIVGIAQNYRAHAAEMGGEVPERPVFFMKFPWTVQDPDAPIALPRGMRSDKVDFEAELAVVIGRRGRNIPKEKALEYVAGYTAANDVSARDWQKEWGGGQFCRGKSFDTFCPLGPVLVTPEEISDPNALQLSSYLNGERMQHSSTGDMIFDVAELIAFVSGSTTLEPGTVILTGTPSGVGSGRKPQVFLQPGDEIVIEIEKIGRLSNPVVEESEKDEK